MGKNQDPLAAAMLGQDGKALEANAEGENAKDTKGKARNLVSLATTALPSGLPAGSQFAKLDKDALIGIANQSNIPPAICGLLSVEELRLVLEYGTTVLGSSPSANTPVGAKPRDTPPPVPMQPTPPVAKKKIRGVPESETGKWRVLNEGQKSVSISGAMSTMRSGAIIELRHYGDAGLRSLVEQGVKLEPISKEEDEE